MKRSLLLIPIVLLVLLATWSLIGQATFLRDSTTPEDWERAATHLTTTLIPEAPEHTKIMVWPVWRETPLPHLVEVDEMLLWQSAPLLEDLQHTTQVLIIAPEDRVNEALDALPFTPTHPPERTDFDSVSTMRVEVPAITQWPSASLAELLPEAKIALRQADTLTPCKSWPERAPLPGWRCAGHPRIVGVSEYELDDEPRRCIMAHAPSKPDATLLLHFPTINPPEHDSTLRIRAGITLRAARLAPQNDDLTLRVTLDGALVATRIYAAQASTWEPLDLPVKQGQDLSTLTLEVSALSSPQKMFCLNGWIIPK